MHRITSGKGLALAVVILLALLWMSGCSNGGGTAAGAGTGDAQAPKPAAAAPAERTVKHLLGETKIAGAPERIVSLHPWISDYLLALGVKPHAAPSAGPKESKFSWYFENSLAGTINLGWQIPEVNLEAILAASPDLIIANRSHEKVYEQLSKIAGTIAIEPVKDDKGVRRMRDTFRQLADMLGMQEKARQAIAEYDGQAQQARERLKEAVGGKTVMFLRVTDKELRYYSPSLFEVLYDDLGLTPPPLIPPATDSYAALSIEKMPEVNPDHIFLLSESADKLGSIQQMSVWKQLDAVKNGRVYAVDYDLWFQGFGPIANKLIIEDAVNKLTKQP